jgi:transcriptional regulator with XRE-family HTH domain
VAQKPAVQTKVETRLAEWRVKREMTQEEVAEATGISLSTYRRMERGLVANPPIGYVANCAVVLGCQPGDILEVHQRGWFQLRPGLRRPADPSALWRRHDEPS